MCLIKSKSEIKLIKKAHHVTTNRVKNLAYEHELQVDIGYVFKKNGDYSDAVHL